MCHGLSSPRKEPLYRGKGAHLEAAVLPAARQHLQQRRAELVEAQQVGQHHAVHGGQLAPACDKGHGQRHRQHSGRGAQRGGGCRAGAAAERPMVSPAAGCPAALVQEPVHTLGWLTCTLRNTLNIRTKYNKEPLQVLWPFFLKSLSRGSEFRI